jgi:8-oxo-dGTP diphosphatase
MKKYNHQSQAIEAYEVEPHDFKAAVEVAGCYLEIDCHILLLQSSPLKPEIFKWGVPAGKLENGELPEDAAKRELFEETGIEIQDSNIQKIGTLYMRKPKIDYAYHLFKITLFSKPQVRLSREHSTYLWASIQDLENLPLMTGAKEGLDKYSSSKETIS